MIGIKLLVVACLLGITLAQQNYQQDYRPAPLRIGTNEAEPKPTPIPILKQINSDRGSRKRCFVMGGSRCHSHSGNSTSSNYHLKGSRDDAVEQTRKQNQQQTVGESENLGTGHTGNGFVVGKKFNKKF